MTTTPFNIIPGFAVPFVHTQVPDSEGLNRRLLELFRAKASDGAVFANPQPSMHASPGLFESRFDLFRWEEPSVQALARFCSAALYKTVQELNGYGEDEINDLQMASDAWFHLTSKGGSFGLHNHPMASWSGIYCVDSGYHADQEPASGCVHFMHPASTAGMFVDLGVANIRAPWAIRPREYRLRPGQVVLFPSWVLHQVSPYLGESQRVTVAFNVWFRKQQSSAKLD